MPAQNKINIVVCTSDTGYRVAVKNKVTDEKFEVIGYADPDASAKTRIAGFVPDIVVLVADSADIDTAYMDFVEGLSLQTIGAIPVLLTDKVSVDVVNKAATAGIRMTMGIDVGGAEFCENLTSIIDRERKFNAGRTSGRKSRSRTYGFFSGKGGVGKTTIATNCAVSLANRGKQVLFVDLDLQFGDADMALDLQPTSTIVDLARDPSGVSTDNLSSCCTTHPSGLQLLASPSSPEQAEYVTSATVKQILDIARNEYEYIILDLGCALVDPVITGIENCDTVFMVNDVNILSLKRAKLCMNVLTQLNQKDKLKLIINKNTKKNTVKIEDFENLLGMSAYAVISSDFKTINASLNNGQPAIVYKPKSPISRDMAKLVNDIILEREGTLKNTNQKAKKKGLFK